MRCAMRILLMSTCSAGAFREKAELREKALGSEYKRPSTALPGTTLIVVTQEARFLPSVAGTAYCGDGVRATRAPTRIR